MFLLINGIPRITTTYGTGELIRAALAYGCRKLIIGIGGSATNDGGAGMAQALGAKLLTASGEQIGPGRRFSGDTQFNQPCPNWIRASLKRKPSSPVMSITRSQAKQGASHVYGPQKGATPEMIEVLDANLTHFDKIVQRDLSKSVGNVPGAGAAGGLGAGLMAFLGCLTKIGYRHRHRSDSIE